MKKAEVKDGWMEAEATSMPEVALAKGVLVQAKRDLRRFVRAQDGVGREMYADARSWVTADDFAWPYSFQNVCTVLGLSPEFLRAELLPELQTGWFGRSRGIAHSISSSLRGSLASAFRDRHHPRRAVLAH